MLLFFQSEAVDMYIISFLKSVFSSSLKLWAIVNYLDPLLGKVSNGQSLAQTLRPCEFAPILTFLLFLLYFTSLYFTLPYVTLLDQ